MMSSKPGISTEQDTVQAIIQWHRILRDWSCILRCAYDQLVLIRVSSLPARDVV